MSEIDQLYLAMITDPDDDTLRLAYADALDDLPTKRIPCPQYGYADGEPHALCARCQGAGTVIDTSDRDRARLIREQIRLEKLSRLTVSPQCGRASDRWCPVCGDCTCRNPEKGLSDAGCPLHDEDSPHAGTADTMRALEENGWRIVQAHPSWKWVNCPACHGSGVPTGCSDDRPLHGDCFECGGVGDALQYNEVVFRRGFLDSIECTAEQLGRDQEVHCPDCNGLGAHPQTNAECYCCAGTAFVTSYVPTPWAIAVVRSFPTLTRLRIRNWPVVKNSSGYSITAHDGRGGRLPEVICRRLNRGPTPKHFASEDAARDALAVSACSSVRRHIVAQEDVI